MKKILLILSLLVLFIPKVYADEKAVLNVFYRESCPHCKDLHSYLDELSKDITYKDMFTVNYIEVTDKNNADLFKKVLTYYGKTSGGVPFYVVGNSYNVGFPNPNSEDDYMKKQFEARSKELKDMIKNAYYNNEANLVEEIKLGNIDVKTTKTTKNVSETTTIKVEKNSDEKIKTLSKKNIVRDYSVVAAICLLLSSSLILLKRKGNLK